MTVTVSAILDTDFVPQKSLAKVMNDTLQRTAKELEQVHLKSLSSHGFSPDDLVIYLSYNQKYKIRYCIVNDVSADVQYFVAAVCARLDFILWKRLLVDAPPENKYLNH